MKISRTHPEQKPGEIYMGLYTEKLAKQLISWKSLRRSSGLYNSLGGRIFVNLNEIDKIGEDNIYYAWFIQEKEVSEYLDANPINKIQMSH